MLRNRFIAALGFALIAGTVIAAPAAAETVLNQCTGNCGYWEVKDQGPTGPKGAVCKYETASYDLDFISVRPPLMHGPWSYKTKVQWMFKIQRTTNFGGSWGNYYASSWQSAMANDAIPAYAGNGFSRRYWYAPDPNPTGWFRVRVYMRWKNTGGTTVGTASVEYDNYRGMWNGNLDYRSDYCLQDW
jgi:hypothetical protein